MKWRTAQPCSCSNCLSGALSAVGTLHAAALAEIKRGKGSPHLSLFPRGFFFLKPLCLQMQLIKLCYGVCHRGPCTCGSREGQLEKSGAGSSWSIPCISPGLMHGPPFVEGLVLSPDPLHYPEIFQGNSQLQSHGWAVDSAHDQSSRGGMERDPGLSEAIALACPLWLLGQPAYPQLCSLPMLLLGLRDWMGERKQLWPHREALSAGGGCFQCLN